MPGALATFDCHVDARHEVGDHTLVVAALTGVNAPGGEALVYQGGRIADALPQVDGPPDDSPFVERYAGALLGRASAEVNADFARTLPDDLKPVHWRILACLSESALTVNALADAVLLKQPTLTRVLDGMVVTGLVTRESDASDRRRVLVTATDSGRERGEALVALAIEREQAFFADWSASERDVLHHLLRRLLADRADANEQPTVFGPCARAVVTCNCLTGCRSHRATRSNQCLAKSDQCGRGVRSSDAIEPHQSGDPAGGRERFRPAVAEQFW